MIAVEDVRSLRDRLGEEIAVSEWLQITQARIDAFAGRGVDRPLLSRSRRRGVSLAGRPHQ
jgi:hypothetical protein